MTYMISICGDQQRWESITAERLAVTESPSPAAKECPDSRHLIGVGGEGRPLEVAAKVPATAPRQVRVSLIPPEAARRAK